MSVELTPPVRGGRTGGTQELDKLGHSAGSKENPSVRGEFFSCPATDIRESGMSK